MPRLSQIREGKKSRSSRSRASSTVSSTVEPRLRRRRTTDDAVNRSRPRHQHGSSQRHNNLANLSNPSLVSVTSDLTQDSNVSLGSNTTVTQRSYDDQSFISDSEAQYDTQGGRSEPSRKMATTETETPQANVFQYMQPVPTVEEYSEEEESHNEPPSTIDSASASSSDESEHVDTQSSNAGSSHFAGDTPTTSPASTRRSMPDAPLPPTHKHRKAAKPLYASSFVHGHGGEDEEQEPEEESDEASEEYSDEGEEGEEEEDDETREVDDGHVHHQALDRVPPPRVPSTSSRSNDPHTRRLKQQERELASHVLQSPQPKKDFQFAGAPSPHPPPQMPLYSPRAYSGAAPANFEPTAGYPPEWPQFPPPLPIGYPTQSMLESPTAGHALPLTVQPPMSVPSLPVQQPAPPFHQHPGQPPQYQAHVPASDVTRTTAAGYELLANKLSETPKKGNTLRKIGKVVPMYRKFEHLNHRVLLHLQDEVCELEEELRYLDDSIMQMSPRDEAGHAYPASRRGDARYGSELHYKRTELLGRIFQKIGQYSKWHA